VASSNFLNRSLTSRSFDDRAFYRVLICRTAVSCCKGVRAVDCLFGPLEISSAYETTRSRRLTTHSFLSLSLFLPSPLQQSSALGRRVARR